MPPDWTAKNGNGEATVRYHRDGAAFVGEINLVLSGGVLDRSAYVDARELLRGVVSAERRPVILAHGAPATAATAAPASP